MILLDTDHFSVFRYAGSATARALRARLDSIEDRNIATTIITYEEQMRGWLAEIHGVRDPVRQVEVYAQLQRMIAEYDDWELVPCAGNAALRFVELRRQYRRLGARDLKIAAISLTNNALLLSANLRDFRQISGLRVENWLAIPGGSASQ